MKKLNKENIEKNQQFRIGDLIKLRPDILNKIHQGPNHMGREWRKTLDHLQDKMGKVIKVETGITRPQCSKNYVNVEYEEPWINTDEFGRKSKLNKIVLQSYLLVPYSEDPSLTTEQFGGYVSDKDMKKDPKHITNERWRIKFQSSDDLKKHGNTEKSDVMELRDLGHMPDNISVKEIREVIQELIKETSENPNKNYIIFGRSGPQLVYYCNSSTQGARLVPYSQDTAERFKTMEAVRNKIIQLKQKYKGILKWDYEIVPAEKSEWEKTYTATVKLGSNTISTPMNIDGEWIVKWMVNGKRDENKTYYTDNRKDAFDTYARMAKSAEEENKKIQQS